MINFSLLLMLLFYGCNCYYNYIYSYVYKPVHKMYNKYNDYNIDSLLSTQALLMVGIDL